MAKTRFWFDRRFDRQFRSGPVYVLVDTGYGDDWDLLRRRLAEAGVSMGGISHLILTHHDDDRVGCTHELIEVNPAIVVVMSAA